MNGSLTGLDVTTLDATTTACRSRRNVRGHESEARLCKEVYYEISEMMLQLSRMTPKRPSEI